MEDVCATVAEQREQGSQPGASAPNDPPKTSTKLVQRVGGCSLFLLLLHLSVIPRRWSPRCHHPVTVFWTAALYHALTTCSVADGDIFSLRFSESETKLRQNATR